MKTDVEPDEAEVWLDGKYIGTADDFDGYPDLLYLEPGKYHLEFKLNGYEPHAVDIDAARGERTRIDHRLKKAPGTPRLSEFSPKKGMPYGRVFGPNAQPVTETNPRARRDDRFDDDRDRYGARGRYDDDDEDIDERPAPRYDRDRDRDDDRPMVRPHDRQMRSDRARLRMKITPEDAQVYVDDKYVGSADDLSESPRGLITEPGKHTVTVTRPGYKTKTVNVEAKAGRPVDVVVDLEK